MNNFDNILWMPVDIPKYQYKKDLIDNFVGDSPPDDGTGAQAFQYQKFTTTNKNYSKSSWIEESSLTKYIDKNLPIDHLVNVRTNNYLKATEMHIDLLTPDKNADLWKHEKSLQPCGYRMTIQYDNNIKNPYIQKNNGETVLAKMPIDTDWCVIRSTDTTHGGNYDPDRFILFTHFWVNKQKHYEILKRSINKYKDYIIYEEE